MALLYCVLYWFKKVYISQTRYTNHHLYRVRVRIKNTINLFYLPENYVISRKKEPFTLISYSSWCFKIFIDFYIETLLPLLKPSNRCVVDKYRCISSSRLDGIFASPSRFKKTDHHFQLIDVPLWRVVNLPLNHVVAAAVVESYCHIINFPEHEREQQQPRGWRIQQGMNIWYMYR